MQNIETSSEQTASDQHVSLDIETAYSIYEVPKHLRLTKSKHEAALTPRIISIGPIHHNRLKEMESLKEKCQREFLKLSQVSEEVFVAAIKDRETELLDCYKFKEKNFKEKFVEMVLLDCSFVIMFLLSLYSTDFQDINSDNIWMSEEIKSDLCLLENQVPFFILEDLLRLSNLPQCHPGKECSMIKLTHKFLSDVWGMWVPEDICDSENLPADNTAVDHFVDFLRICQRPKEQSPKEKLATLTVPTVAELHRVGIKFKSGSSKNLFDIKFHNNKGILEIPQLKISEPTKNLFRNLQVFEQCKYGGGHVCDYITMISSLVSVTEDVKILVNKGIIEHSLKDNYALSRFLKELRTKNSLSINRFYFTGVVKKLKEDYEKRRVHCNKRIYRWKAEFCKKYFSSPWAITSVIAAAVLLILTVIQTVCSILQV